MTPGKTEGKVIPITLSQFVIGRDPQCHLRPASALISKRHCALLVRDEKAYVRDFDSTNGTLLNDQPVKGEVELHADDLLKVGPLLFGVRLEAAPPPVNRPTPPPPAKKPAAAESSDDDSIAAMLMEIDDGTPASAGGDVPEGSTVMDLPVTPEGAPPKEGADGKDKGKAKPAAESTSTAAKAILEKYMRRPRQQP
jgi:pSer/pThr/pTyr-binding forkhead associated (FHA) protein